MLAGVESQAIRPDGCIGIGPGQPTAARWAAPVLRVPDVSGTKIWLDVQEGEGPETQLIDCDHVTDVDVTESDNQTARDDFIQGRRSFAVVDLYAFVLVSQHQSFSAAAEAANISQPGFSQRVRRLEDALGFLLIDRSRRPVKLTPAGEAMLPYARRAIGFLQSGQDAAQRAPNPASRDGSGRPIFPDGGSRAHRRQPNASYKRPTS